MVAVLGLMRADALTRARWTKPHATTTDVQICTAVVASWVVMVRVGKSLHGVHHSIEINGLSDGKPASVGASWVHQWWVTGGGLCSDV